jgi:hypothetical protein
MKYLRSTRLSHSKAIVDHSYDANKQRMMIRWRDSGKAYTYDGVTQKEYDAFATAESLGRHFNQHIRKQHPGKRIEA